MSSDFSTCDKRPHKSLKRKSKILYRRFECYFAIFIPRMSTSNCIAKIVWKLLFNTQQENEKKDLRKQKFCSKEAIEWPPSVSPIDACSYTQIYQCICHIWKEQKKKTVIAFEILSFLFVLDCYWIYFFFRRCHSSIRF